METAYICRASASVTHQHIDTASHRKSTSVPLETQTATQTTTQTATQTAQKGFEVFSFPADQHITSFFFSACADHAPYIHFVMSVPTCSFVGSMHTLSCDASMRCNPKSSKLPFILSIPCAPPYTHMNTHTHTHIHPSIVRSFIHTIRTFFLYFSRTSDE